MAVTDQMVENLDQHINSRWLVLNAIFVFLMQVGFGMLETGAVQAKNVRNILVKNVLDLAITGLCFWLIGYAVAFGCTGWDSSSDSGVQNCRLFYGHNGFVLDGDAEHEDVSYVHFFFQYTFVSTAVTIVSGSVCERMRLQSYLLVSLALSSFVYPVVAHWIWGGGLFHDTPVVDFAGAGVVHLTGGYTGLLGAAIVGPRLGRFDGKRFRTVRLSPFRPRSSSFAALGTLMLWTGWYGFNCGSVSPYNANTVELVAINTTLAATGACLAYAVFAWAQSKNMIVNRLLNSLLTALVAITAGCNIISPVNALIVGSSAALVYIAFSNLINLCNIDDPLDAAAVHLGGGLWGTVAVALFAERDKVIEYYGEDADRLINGLFFGGNIKFLGWQLLYCVAIMLWVTVTVGVLLAVLKKLKKLRVEPEVEILGLDLAFHGGIDDSTNMTINDILETLRSRASEVEDPEFADLVQRLVTLSSL